MITGIGKHNDASIKRAAKRVGVTEKFYRGQMEKGLKRCSDCHEWKNRNTEDFGPRPEKGDGLNNYCRVCTRKSLRDRRKRTGKKI